MLLIANLSELGDIAIVALAVIACVSIVAMVIVTLIAKGRLRAILSKESVTVETMANNDDKSPETSVVIRE